MVYEMGASVVPANEKAIPLWSTLEAAGCADRKGPDVFDCVRKAVARGHIEDPAIEGAPVNNAIQACKRGGVASCTFLMQQGNLTGAPCFKTQIEGWNDNVTCNCETATCHERVSLTSAQRARQQRGGMSPMMMAGIAAAGAGAIWILMRRRGKGSK